VIITTYARIHLQRNWFLIWSMSSTLQKFGQMTILKLWQNFCKQLLASWTIKDLKTKTWKTISINLNPNLTRYSNNFSYSEISKSFKSKKQSKTSRFLKTNISLSLALKTNKSRSLKLISQNQMRSLTIWLKPDASGNLSLKSTRCIRLLLKRNSKYSSPLKIRTCLL